MVKEDKKNVVKARLIAGGVFFLTIGVFFAIVYSQNYVKTYKPDESHEESGEFVLENANDKIIHRASDENGGIGDRVRGKVDSKVVFVEYADMQCPGCAASYGNVEKLTKKYGDKVAFVFRQFPLSMHENARSSAAAVESAGQQGYFWEMISALYSRRDEWIPLRESALLDKYQEIFASVAPDGDAQKFRDGISSTEIKKKVDYDYKFGRETDKVNATPSFYINGVAIDIGAAQTQVELNKLLELAIEAAIDENGA
jgi:protein-disulfide isomerase